MAINIQLKSPDGTLLYPKTTGENVYVDGKRISEALNAQNENVANQLAAQNTAISNQLATQNQLVSGQISAVNEIISTKANKATQIITNIPSNSWVGTQAPFTASIQVPGITQDTIGDIGLSNSATFEQRQVAMAAIISPVNSTNGYVNLVADGEKPAVDLPILIRILE